MDTKRSTKPLKSTELILYYDPGFLLSHPNAMFLLRVQAFKEYRKKRNPMLRGRKNEILLPFKFWGEIEPREDKWIYEMRSYALEVQNSVIRLVKSS